MTSMEQIDAERIRVNELMRAGHVALGKGDRKGAHRLWRQVAALEPENEHVWLSLLTVVDTHEDRRVCLENIVRINPRNVQAANQLNEFRDSQHNTRPIRVAGRRLNLTGVMRRTLAILLYILLMVVLFVLGVVVGMLLNVF